jgi:hypothetical protein
MPTELQRRALALPAARAMHVRPGSWDHFEQVRGGQYGALVGLTVNR